MWRQMFYPECPGIWRNDRMHRGDEQRWCLWCFTVLGCRKRWKDILVSSYDYQPFGDKGSSMGITSTIRPIPWCDRLYEHLTGQERVKEHLQANEVLSPRHCQACLYWKRSLKTNQAQSRAGKPSSRTHPGSSQGGPGLSRYRAGEQGEPQHQIAEVRARSPKVTYHRVRQQPEGTRTCSRKWPMEAGHLAKQGMQLSQPHRALCWNSVEQGGTGFPYFRPSNSP